ncbi:hypothetical protein EV196_11345 [Mariniflexile fucanivorans]|uniref:Uncharacterized protein n=1 Tax=Mariniflexile fucanivorans TaxID=264023 RepID=A0A4R1R9U3_9FLAO|nr:hypothetical protein [Mariniflexile fucanivorans]TCL62503.1 hypothetical protein EV196_11345 [Mariniflexile fucanivorans]
MGLNDLIGGKEDKKEVKKNTSKIVDIAKKSYKRLYISQEAIGLLNDITFSKEQSGDYNYTQGDAVLDALKLLAKKLNVQKAPEGYKKK